VRREGGDEGDVARFREIGGQFARSRRLRPNDWTPEEVERRIWNEDVEWAYVFDPMGRQVLRKRGTADGVFFASGEVPLLKDAMLIHNHPPFRRYDRGDPRHEGGSFSDRDLNLVLIYDIAEMSVVTPGWRYTLVRPRSGWLPDAESAVAAFAEQLERIRSGDREAVASGRLPSLRHAQATQAHRVMQRMAIWGQFDYRREER
jgi:hypothetical protein